MTSPDESGPVGALESMVLVLAEIDDFSAVHRTVLSGDWPEVPAITIAVVHVGCQACFGEEPVKLSVLETTVKQIATDRFSHQPNVVNVVSHQLLAVTPVGILVSASGVSCAGCVQLLTYGGLHSRPSRRSSGG